MRILYICGDLGIQAFGRKGASSHIREMIAAFRGEGHEVCLAAADLGGDRRADEDFPTVALPRPRSKAIGHDGRYLLANMRARAILRGAAESFKPEAIYERSALYFRAGEWLERQTGLPRILEVNALLSHEQSERLHFPSLAWKYEMELLRNARAIAAISGHLARRISEARVGNADVRPFPMAVDPARFHPVEGPNGHRARLGWGDDVIVLGYIGSMNTYHRPNWFMDLAEKILRREERQFRFLVVGGSPVKVQRHRSRLYKWVEQGLVHFTGTVPQVEIAEWIAAMDVVLVPGAAPQSTPTKIFETAAVGRPLIVPRTEPIEEICGVDSPALFRPDDFNDFEARVRDFAARRMVYESAARALHAKVATEHTWERHARALTRWFEELARARPDAAGR